jgi:hypothetical protein
MLAASLLQTAPAYFGVLVKYSLKMFFLIERRSAKRVKESLTFVYGARPWPHVLLVERL